MADLIFSRDEPLVCVPRALSDKLQVPDLAAQLQRNAQEDYRVYHRIAAAARRGVRLMQYRLHPYSLTAKCADLTSSPAAV